ncbi:DinB family protein [Sporichthya polymorpha]|uniref:DinB family protein n=1 Tax=Sporichthya polymorpha TaxID=35751 RepID=UPI000381625E|nr:DinB family protein [Sporichthya polymorpha]
MAENPLNEPKTVLHRYFTGVRDAVLWKLEDLSEYDARRPLTPTGTNVLGVAKHLACVELGYFGWTFGRATDITLPWYDDDAEPNADMFATESESKEEIIAFWRRVREISDATITELPLDAPGHVPWWGDRNPVTLQVILVHMIAEANRHAGQVDIVRELIDGQIGIRADNSNLPDEINWPEYHARLETLAARFR